MCGDDRYIRNKATLPELICNNNWCQGKQPGITYILLF